LDEKGTALTILLTAGADPMARDKVGKTALHYAVDRKSVTLVAMPLRYGADPDIS
jgi:ankyrin repeat protein